MIRIREFEAAKDLHEVEKLEYACEVGNNKKLSLFTDLLGDPLCRVRHSPLYVMLVAQYGDEGRIVGLIRGSIKTVSCGKLADSSPLCARVAYMLGLRVSPSHRRMGIGLKLVQELEKWLRQNGAEYAYMATEKDNEASINLFMEKLNYKKFRTPALLGHPVHSHCKKISSRIKILKLHPSEAMELYKTHLGWRDFFPHDMESILHNKLSLGTWVAFYNTKKGKNHQEYESWPSFLQEEEGYCWAMVSVWDSGQSFKLEVRGASLAKYMYSKGSQLLDKTFPFLQFPSVPDVFHPFGVLFLYGFHLQNKGPISETKKKKLVRSLFWFVHNMAAKEHKECRVIATEVGNCDPLRHLIPYWSCFSCTEDIWCIKKLNPLPNPRANQDHFSNPSLTYSNPNFDHSPTLHLISPTNTLEHSLPYSQFNNNSIQDQFSSPKSNHSPTPVLVAPSSTLDYSSTSNPKQDHFPNPIPNHSPSTSHHSSIPNPIYPSSTSYHSSIQNPNDHLPNPNITNPNPNLSTSPHPISLDYSPIPNPNYLSNSQLNLHSTRVHLPNPILTANTTPNHFSTPQAISTHDHSPIDRHNSLPNSTTLNHTPNPNNPNSFACPNHSPNPNHNLLPPSTHNQLPSPNHALIYLPNSTIDPTTSINSHSTFNSLQNPSLDHNYLLNPCLDFYDLSNPREKPSFLPNPNANLNLLSTPHGNPNFFPNSNAKFNVLENPRAKPSFLLYANVKPIALSNPHEKQAIPNFLPNPTSNPNHNENPSYLTIPNGNSCQTLIPKCNVVGWDWTESSPEMPLFVDPRDF